MPDDDGRPWGFAEIKNFHDFGDVLAAIDKELKCLQSAGTSAVGGAMEAFSDPGIRINNERMAVPLREEDAQKIIAASHQAHFGRGSETVVDTSIRRTWELNADQFQTYFYPWSAHVSTVLDQVSVGLGLEHAFDAQLYKMLLYEKGAMFRPHQDYESTLASAALHWFVTEVQEGYRWVLTYNLVYKSIPNLPKDANSIHSAGSRLRAVLRAWNAAYEIDGVWDRGIYQLQHKYTDASLTINTLKGDDSVRAHALEAASLDGTQLAEDIPVEEDQVICEIPYNERDPDEEGYTGFTGNAGAEAEHWYRDTICEYTIKHNRDAATRSIYGPYGDSLMFEPNVFDLVVDCCGRLEDLDLWNRLARDPCFKLSASAWNAVHRLVQTFGFEKLCTSIETQLSRYFKLHERVTVLQTLVRKSNAAKSNDTTGISALETWVVIQVKRALSCCTCSTQKDGNALAELLSFRVLVPEIEEIVMNTLKTHANAQSLVGFIIRMEEHLRMQVAKEEVASRLKPSVDMLIPMFSLCKGGKLPVDRKYQAFSCANQKKEPPFSEDTLFHLLQGLLRSSLYDEALQLLQTIAQEASKVPVEHLESMLIPFLRLALVFRSHFEIPPTCDIVYIYMYRDVLFEYLTRHVGIEPVNRSDWSQPPLSCSCEDCQRVSDFLVRPDQGSMGFPINKGRRAHIHQMVGNDHIHETKRNGSPYTLVITKTNRIWERAHNAWKDRALKAWNTLHDFPEDQMRAVLGNMYDTLVFCLTPIRADVDQGNNTSAAIYVLTARGERAPPLSAGSGNRQPVQSQRDGLNLGSKRKADIIDLTETSSD
ncbi:hypothetical protein BDY21DRAFT_360389 [Lineolata rhizophorae]|uniref:Prolyl 4-hydroxylase alpha subunit Fe(2+) 2OG dioxygenase domain-containing protein n=1 Tax=Lineolata rhizophorae TaxID=578093 RepID=A0A6A6PBJ9_9PEZI|nr:hypothetical protein BDY21DRAFT_360389 [Lineolata rhizophorae]